MAFFNALTQAPLGMFGSMPNPLTSTITTTKPSSTPYSGFSLDSLPQIANTIVSTPTNAVSSVSNAASSAVSSVGNVATSIVDKAGDTISDVTKGITDTLGNLTNILPYFAVGVVVFLVISKK
jgi:hypothetical protein